MKHNLLDEIKGTRQTCYFISPHYDDMVFSAGALASELGKTNRIVVVNIFTKASHIHTQSAKAYLRQCNYSDAEKLYRDRHDEDKVALKDVADEVIDLGFCEALWRKKPGKLFGLLGKLAPEFDSVYPTYRFNIIKGKIAKGDRQLLSDIKRKLEAIVPSRDAMVFCPLGIGSHVDHIITHKVCTDTFSGPIYWEDYPYVLNNQAGQPLSGDTFSYSGHTAEKAQMIAAYKTQYAAMFGTDGPRLEPERFHIA